MTHSILIFYTDLRHRAASSAFILKGIEVSPALSQAVQLLGKYLEAMVGHQVKKDYNMRLISSGFYLPYNPELVQRAREMRQNPTPTEKKLWYGFLQHFKYRVLRQRPIDNYIVDFYIARLKLVIEIDGEIHFTNVGKEYDEARTKTLEGHGLRVIRFTNQEVLNNFESVCQAIQEIPPCPPL